jgi:hypothetical protein
MALLPGMSADALVAAAWTMSGADRSADHGLAVCLVA